MLGIELEHFAIQRERLLALAVRLGVSRVTYAQPELGIAASRMQRSRALEVDCGFVEARSCEVFHAGRERTLRV